MEAKGRYQMKLRFKETRVEAGDVRSYIFAPEEPLEWIAGQSIRLELPRPTYGVDDRRFTIASAPCEKDIVIATRKGISTFKQTLASVKPGDIVNAYAIEGEFVWGPEERPRLFIAGGIGITPFRPMLFQRLHDHQPIGVSLLYSNPDQHVPFKPELDRWAGEHREFDLHYLIGERITAGYIKAHAPKWQESLVYISGPEGMVEALSRALIAEGLPPSHLKKDRFTGLNPSQ
jgi:ferredoxin-NADP reductase